MRWLSADGLLAAVLVGATTALGLGWRGVVLLLAFFLSGSLLTQCAGGPEGRRNARQVLANGAVAAVAALLGAWPAAAGAVAAATADTWATEIGAFSPRPPRLITTWAEVARGTSGGITPLGTAGGVLGGGVIAVLAWLLAPPTGGPGSAELGAAVAGAGVTGMLVDSLLGATLQGEFECGSCGARCERRGVVCHEPVRLIRGRAWLDNDGVNFLATLTGAAAASVL